MDLIKTTYGENTILYEDAMSIQDNILSLNNSNCLAFGSINYIKNDVGFDSNYISRYEVGILGFNLDNNNNRDLFSAKSLGINKIDKVSSNGESVGLISKVSHKYNLNPDLGTTIDYNPEIGDIVRLEIGSDNSFIKTIYTFDGVDYKKPINKQIPSIDDISKDLNLPICNSVDYGVDNQFISDFYTKNEDIMAQGILDEINMSDNYIFYTIIIFLILVIGVLIFKLTKKDKSI